MTRPFRAAGEPLPPGKPPRVPKPWPINKPPVSRKPRPVPAAD
jgi:hypothetical protein